ICRHGDSTGPGRFSADIDYLGALRHHEPRMRNRTVQLDELSAIRIAVRRDVQNAHEQGLCAEIQVPTVGKLPACLLHRPQCLGTSPGEHNRAPVICSTNPRLASFEASALGPSEWSNGRLDEMPSQQWSTRSERWWRRLRSAAG